MKRAHLTAAIAGLLVIACQDHQQPTAPPGAPSLEIRDGFPDAPGDDVTSGFFFLWPIRTAAQEATVPDEGFNGTLLPAVQVQICQLPGCTVVKTLTMAPDPTTGSSTLNRVFVFPDHHEYAALWVARGLTPGKNYRIRVLVGGKELGFADVDVLTSLSQVLTYPDRDDFVPLLKKYDLSALPIRFWISDEAFKTGDEPLHADHVVTTVTNEGTGNGAITTSTGDAGARFPADWLPAEAVEAGITEVALLIERIAVGGKERCFSTDLLEAEGCYRFRTFPDLKEFGAFSQDITLGWCTSLPLGDDATDFDRSFQPHRQEETGDGKPDPEAPLQALQQRDVDFLTCDDFPFADLGSSGGVTLQNLVRAGWGALQRVGEWLEPRALHARTAMIDFGVGTVLRADNEDEAGFSRYSYARQARMTLAAGDDQTAVVGNAVAINPKVCLETLHPTPRPMVGETVTFTAFGPVGAPAGVANPVQPTTGSDGCASTTWTLSATPGENTLWASAVGVEPRPVVFTATGTSVGIDGILSAGEWDGALQITFDANLPEGGTTPATLYLKNDTRNLYLAVQYDRGTADLGTQVIFEFDNDGDLIRENGDDVFLHGSDGVFVDDFRTACEPGGAEGGCGPRDTERGGSNDGMGAFRQEGTLSVFEVSHPLNSGDQGHDFALSVGSQFGMFLILHQRGVTETGGSIFVDSFYPGPGFGTFRLLRITEGGIELVEPTL